MSGIKDIKVNHNTIKSINDLKNIYMAQVHVPGGIAIATAIAAVGCAIATPFVSAAAVAGGAAALWAGALPWITGVSGVATVIGGIITGKYIHDEHKFRKDNTFSEDQLNELIDYIQSNEDYAVKWNIGLKNLRASGNKKYDVVGDGILYSEKSVKSVMHGHEKKALQAVKSLLKIAEAKSGRLQALNKKPIEANSKEAKMLENLTADLNKIQECLKHIATKRITTINPEDDVANIIDVNPYKETIINALQKGNLAFTYTAEQQEIKNRLLNNGNIADGAQLYFLMFEKEALETANAAGRVESPEAAKEAKKQIFKRKEFYESQVNRQKELVKAAEQVNADLKAEIAEKDDTITTQNTTIGTQNTTISEQNTTITERNRIIEEQVKKIELAKQINERLKEVLGVEVDIDSIKDLPPEEVTDVLVKLGRVLQDLKDKGVEADQLEIILKKHLGNGLSIDEEALEAALKDLTEAAQNGKADTTKLTKIKEALNTVLGVDIEITTESTKDSIENEIRANLPKGDLDTVLAIVAKFLGKTEVSVDKLEAELKKVKEKNVNQIFNTNITKRAEALEQFDTIKKKALKYLQIVLNDYTNNKDYQDKAEKLRTTIENTTIDDCKKVIDIINKTIEVHNYIAKAIKASTLPDFTLGDDYSQEIPRK